MQYETILYSVESGVGRITLNRPEKLNSFNAQMHGELRAALARLTPDGARVLVLTGAGRGFCAGQDLGDRAVGAGREGRRSRRLDRGELQAPGARAACFADARDRRGQRRRGRCRREHRARLRSRRRGALGRVRAGVLSAWARAGQRRHVVPAAARGQCARDRARDAGREARRGAGRRLGAHLAVRRRRGARLRRSTGSRTALAAAPTLGLARTKQAIYGGWSRTLEEQLDVERDMQRELGWSADYAEGVAAFTARRAPVFHGR